MLLSQMLREMRASMFDDGEDTGFSSGPLSDTLFTELSLALSRAGGVGSRPVRDGAARASGRRVDRRGGRSPRPNPRPRRSGLHDPVALRDGLPVAGRVTSGYGWRQDPIDGSREFHKGTDIALPIGHEVPAARPGQVTFAGELPGYGLTVVVEHDGEMATRYAHLSEATVGRGTRGRRAGDRQVWGQREGHRGPPALRVAPGRPAR